MKKILVLVGLLTSMYAIPPCELPNQNICAYLYKGAMSSEIILTNMSRDKILIEYFTATLDGRKREIKNLTLLPNQNLTFLKSQYDTHDKKPSYYIDWINYKVIK